MEQLFKLIGALALVLGLVCTLNSAVFLLKLDEPGDPQHPLAINSPVAIKESRLRAVVFSSLVYGFTQIAFSVAVILRPQTFLRVWLWAMGVCGILSGVSLIVASFCEAYSSSAGANFLLSMAANFILAFTSCVFISSELRGAPKEEDDDPELVDASTTSSYKSASD